MSKLKKRLRTKSMVALNIELQCIPFRKIDAFRRSEIGVGVRDQVFTKCWLRIRPPFEDMFEALKE